MVSFSSRTFHLMPVTFQFMAAPVSASVASVFEIAESDVELMVDHANSEKEA